VGRPVGDWGSPDAVGPDTGVDVTTYYLTTILSCTIAATSLHLLPL